LPLIFDNNSERVLVSFLKLFEVALAAFFIAQKPTKDILGG